MKWQIDKSHTDTSFSVKHMAILNVRGSFQSIEGSVTTNEQGEIVSVDASIDARSIITRDKDRDNHLMAEDFFFVSKYPTIKFESTKITKKSSSEFLIEGNLTIRGVTKKVTLETTVAPEIKDPFGFRRIALEGSTEINRKDFGMVWNQIMDNGGLVVGEKVKITIDSEIICQ
jgi:polyisoprenoid-binding protein YceI